MVGPLFVCQGLFLTHRFSGKGIVHSTYTAYENRRGKKWIIIKIFVKKESPEKLTYAAMLLESGHRSIVAWNFMFSICFLSISLSICARMERSRFEAKWEPERPLYTRAKNRSTKERKREGRRERGHALLMSVARDLSFNQSAESAAVAA